MTRATLRAFKCRQGVHRWIVGWFLGQPGVVFCRDCRRRGRP